MKSTSDTQLLERIHSLPPDKQAEVADFVEFLVARVASDRLEDALPSIDDLVGTLGWQGDAVEVQRAMRDEWR